MKLLQLFFLLMLISSTTLGQTCDPLETMKQAAAETNRIDAENKSTFDQLGLELQKKSGISDEQLDKVKLNAMLNKETLSQQRDLKSDMTVMLKALSQKDCAEIERISKLNHERAQKEWGIAIKNIKNEIIKY